MSASRGNTARNIASGLAIMLLAGSSSFSAVDAKPEDGRQPAAERLDNSNRAASDWSAGPIMLSLIEVARHEAPIGGADPTSKSAVNGPPVGAADYGYPAPAGSTPVASLTGPAR